MKHLKNYNQLFENNSEKPIINKSDEDYRDAVNFNGDNYYNFPSTITVNGKKFIMGFGTSDRVTIIDNAKYNYPENKIYVISENNPLNYISLAEIDLENDTVNDVFLESSDIDDETAYSYDILNKDEKEQLKILMEYL